MHCLCPELTTPDQALSEPACWLARAADKAAREFTLTRKRRNSVNEAGVRAVELT